MVSSSWLEVVRNRLAEDSPVGLVAILGGMGGVPTDLESQIHGGVGGVFSDPVLAYAPPKWMVAWTRDADFFG